MYCRNCGREISDNASICVGCGVDVNEGNNYCPNCGQVAKEQASVCLNCGFDLKKKERVGEKSKVAAGLLAIFLGHLGVHQFYLGYTGRGVLLIVLTIIAAVLSAFGVGFILLAAIWIWCIIDAIMCFTGSKKDAKGNTLK